MNILQLKTDATESIASHQIIDSQDATIVQLQLKEGEMLREHFQDRTMYVIVQKGKVTFMITGEKVSLDESILLRLDPHERHAVTAETDCSLLLIKVGKPHNEEAHPPVTGK